MGQFERFCLFRKIIKSRISESKRIIDAGCGNGLYSIYCGRKNRNAKVFSYDLIENKMLINRLKHFRLINVGFYKHNLCNDFPDKNIDFIISIDVLEHIYDYKKVIHNIYSSLKNGGVFYLHVPKQEQARIFRRFKDWNILDHVRNGFGFEELSKVLRQSGFHILRYGYSFGLLGRLSWELDRLTDFNIYLKYLILPLLKFLVLTDVIIPKENGNGIWFLAKK